MQRGAIFARRPHRPGAVVAFRLVDGDHVGDFEHALLDALQFVAGAGQHHRSIPIALDWFAMQNNVHFVLFAQAQQQVPRRPHIVGGFGRAFGKDLELPLSLRHLGVDALVIDACGKTEFQVFLHYFAGHATHVLVTDAAVVG